MRPKIRSDWKGVIAVKQMRKIRDKDFWNMDFVWYNILLPIAEDLLSLPRSSRSWEAILSLEL